MRRLRIDGARLKKMLKPKTVVLASVILVVVISLSVVAYKNKSTKPDNPPVVMSCSDVINSAKTKLLNSQRQEAYDLLKKHEEVCAQNSGVSTKVKIDKLRYDSALAEASFANGDKQQAYKYAGVASDIHKSFSQADRKNIENLPQIENILLNILGQQETDKISGGATQ